MSDTFSKAGARRFAPGPLKELSGRSATIMQMLSSGFSEDEILAMDPQIDRSDIVAAAKEALKLNAAARVRDSRVAKVLQSYPRAYEKWTPDEEKRVAELYRQGKTMREIGAVVARQPNSIRARLEKMGCFR